MRDAVGDWQALSALYEQAETLTAPALDEWLERLRREDHPLVEPLQQMLGARAEVQGNGFLSALPKLTSMAAALSDDRTGERVGPYRLLAPIGAGGMAEVWRAERDDGAFRRTVAIKLLFRHVGGARGDSFAQRFDRERDILASLDHPNIAGLHDAGVTPAGQPWLALEYVEGEPLIAWCDKARLGVRGRVEVFRQVLLAVEHAHANLVIHRDLKPANILVSAAGEVRLLDFGIAKLMESEGGVLDDTELTRHAGRLMTVAYASPEQLTGRPLTTATDVYSLGVVLYELLCGERPYEVRKDLSARLEQAILEADPRPPSRRALTEAVAAARCSTVVALRKVLVRDLDAVVLRALAKQPARRYGSVEALRVELDRWLTGEPVDARTPSGAERLRKFVFRHPVGVSLGAAATLALVAVAGAAIALGLQAREESARATAARDFMMGMFKQADSDKSHGADMTARELLDRGRDDVLRRLKGQPALQADLLQGIAGIQSSMDELTKADITLDQLSKLYRQMGEPQKLASALAARANIALRMGHLQPARSLVAEAETVARPGDAKFEIGISLTKGWLSLWQGDAGAARQTFTEELVRAESALGRTSSEALQALVGLLQSQVNLHDFDAALVTQAKLSERQMRAPDRSARDVIDLDVGNAELLYLAGHFRESAEVEQTAIARCVSALGTSDPTCRRLVFVGAAANFSMGFMDRVRRDMSVLLSIADDPSSPDFQVSALLLAFKTLWRLDALGEQPDLISRLRSVANSDQARQFDPMQRVKALQALAERALTESEFGEAENLLNRAMNVRLVSGDKSAGSATTATTRMLRGAVLLAGARAADALREMQAAHAGAVEALGETHPRTLLLSINLARALAMSDRCSDASAILGRAERGLRDTLGTESPVYQRVVVLKSTLEAAALGGGAATACSVGRPLEAAVNRNERREFFD